MIWTPLHTKNKNTCPRDDHWLAIILNAMICWFHKNVLRIMCNLWASFVLLIPVLQKNKVKKLTILKWNWNFFLYRRNWHKMGKEQKEKEAKNSLLTAAGLRIRTPVSTAKIFIGTWTRKLSTRVEINLNPGIFKLNCFSVNIDGNFLRSKSGFKIDVTKISVSCRAWILQYVRHYLVGLLYRFYFKMTATIKGTTWKEWIWRWKYRLRMLLLGLISTERRLQLNWVGWCK